MPSAIGRISPNQKIPLKRDKKNHEIRLNFYFSVAMYILDEHCARNSGSAVSIKINISLVILRIFVGFINAKHNSTALLKERSVSDEIRP